MSTKVVTGKARLSYCNLVTPKAIQDNQEPKYSVSIIIPKSDTATLEKIKKGIAAAIEAKKELFTVKGVLQKNIKSPLRDGDVDRAGDPAYEDAFFINANSKQKPQLVDKDLNPIIDATEIYSGCYGRVSINFYAFSVNGNKGIAAGLGNVQKLADGEPLGGGTTAAVDFGDDFQDEDDLG